MRNRKPKKTDGAPGRPGRRRRRRRLAAAAIALACGAVLAVAALAGSTGSGEPSAGKRAEGKSASARSAANRRRTGPRKLPPTFVPLELNAFPRRARDACRDNGRVVRVRPPRGIARALAAAQPGTTVIAAPGTYMESPGEATALEWDTRNVCLRARRGRRAVLRAAPRQKYGISIGGSDTVIEGLTLRGFTSSIGMSAGNGKTQRRVTIERVRVERPRGSFRDGIVAYDDNRDVRRTPPTVDGLLLHDVSVRGADLGVSCNSGPCKHWWIERTRIRNRRGSTNSGADTFAIEEGRQIVVVDSTMSRAGADGIDTKADDVVVFGVRVLGVARNSVKLWRGGDVIDTVVDGSGADASLVGDGPGRYRYLHVLVTHHGRSGDTGYVGTWAYDDPRRGLRIEIVNSIFDDNATGGLFASAGTRLSVRRTIFGDRQAKLFDLSGGRLFMTSQLRAFEAAGYGQGNLAADPRLLRRNTRWSPGARSPALDAAERVSGLTRDLYGRSRVTGGGPDIGPVERRSRTSR